MKCITQNAKVKQHR